MIAFEVPLKVALKSLLRSVTDVVVNVSSWSPRASSHLVNEEVVASLPMLKVIIFEIED